MTEINLEQLRDLAIYIKDLEQMILWPPEDEQMKEPEIQKIRTVFAKKTMEQATLQSQHYNWLASLPVYQKTVVYLYYFLGFLQEEVIEYTGISKSDWFKINYEVFENFDD
ncbi:MAG: hypothetical protein RSE43_07765, partial [Oscillospiraceae bacterium]